jgi:hypothetical protein
VQHAANPLLGLISETLRADYDAVAKEPLPKRWIELIHYLDERGSDEVERHQREERFKPRPH